MTEASVDTRIAVMLERTRLAMRRLLTMSNLFENLCHVYGDREVLDLAEPLGYRLFPSARISCRECLRFTNLAAEALIRDLDLKKGERVLVAGPGGCESILVAVSLIKAGGIAVPLDAGLSAEEMRARAEGCGASLAVVDGRLLAERPDLAESMSGVERIAVSGPLSHVPRGFLSLDEAMSRSSGFFIPYTLKPSNVVALLHTEMEEGSLRAVMITNQGLLGPQIRAFPLLPSRPGDLCIHAMGLRSACGIGAAVLGLCMGLRMRFLPAGRTEDILEALERFRPAAFMAGSATYPDMLAAVGAECDLSSLRLWLSCGQPLPGSVRERFRAFSAARTQPSGIPAAFVEAYDAGGRATLLALKPAFGPFTWPERCPGFAIPPNRLEVAQEPYGAQGRGKEGELIIRGPAVTPGYWNDVEGTMAVKRDGWLHTSIKASKKRFLATLL